MYMLELENYYLVLDYRLFPPPLATCFIGSICDVDET